jgi:hypothetical protein
LQKNALREGRALHSISSPLITGCAELLPPEGQAERETPPSVWGLLSIDAKAGIAALNQKKAIGKIAGPVPCQVPFD